MSGAEDTANGLQAALADLKVGLVHRRLKANQKEAVMRAFKAGELDLLVATTVIEVVLIPNASLMIMKTQNGGRRSCQLRGRVSRGSTASHCFLLYKIPLSKTARND